MNDLQTLNSVLIDAKQFGLKKLATLLEREVQKTVESR